MTTVDDLWYLADRAGQQAEQTYHDLAERYDDYVEFEKRQRMSRGRFRTVTERIGDNGVPYGTHTVVHRPGGEVLLVRHDSVGLWVLPGGETDCDESFRAAARRELREEAGIDATYRGLGMLGRVRFLADDHRAWGVLPVFEATADDVRPSASDPDGEISEARWFDDLPADTRDRQWLRSWRERKLGNPGTDRTRGGVSD